MKVTAFVASPRKKHTYTATEKFLNNLTLLGDVECEIVPLNEYNIKVCRGCKLCFEKGENCCPLKDDRDILIDKMMTSDGVIFATPNYSFHVSALMKIFLDRLGFVFHRPKFFGKTFTCIVAQGIYGGNQILKYLNFIGRGLGFNVVKGGLITTLEPMTEKQQIRNDRTIEKLSKKYYAGLLRNQYPIPSLFKLLIFRMSRSSMKTLLDESYYDYSYYVEKGWFKSDFYYPVRLNIIKRLAGRTFDWFTVRTSQP